MRFFSLLAIGYWLLAMSLTPVAVYGADEFEPGGAPAGAPGGAAPGPPPSPELQLGETGGLSPLPPTPEFPLAGKGPGGTLELLNIFRGKAGVPALSPMGQPEAVIGRIIQLVMVGIGAIFGVLVIYGGYLWMVARGNEELVTQAFETIRNATIGIVIIVGAYALTSFVVNKVITAAFTP